jgi:hypothetical protein
VFVTVTGSCTLCPGEADSVAFRKARARFGTCVTVKFNPPVLCGGVAVMGGATVVVVGSATLVSVFDGDGVVRGGVVTTGVINVDAVEDVVAGVRCVVRVVLRGDGLVTAACVLGVGLTVGVLVGVILVATGGGVIVVVVVLLVAAVVAGCVPVCWPLLLFAPLRPVFLRGVVTGGDISVDGLVLAISVVGLPVICRGRRGVCGLLPVAVLVEVVFVLGVLTGDGVTLAVVTGCERAGVGDGVAATAVLVLDSVVRAGTSRRALLSSLS